MLIKRKVILTFLLTIITYLAYTQSPKIDSLKNELPNATGLTKAKLLHELSEGFGNLSPKESNKYCFQGIEILSKENDDSLKASFYHMLVYNYGVSLGNYDSAIYYNQFSIDLAKKINNRELLATSYLLQGLIYWKVDKYVLAIDFLNKSIEIGTELGLKYFTGMAYNNLGLIYFDMGDYDRALKSYFKLLNISTEAKRLQGIGVAHSNIGEVYLQIDSLDKALNHLFKSEKIFIKLNCKDYLSGNYHFIAKVYARMDKDNMSKIYFDKSMNIMKELGLKDGIANTLLELGRLNFKNHDYDNAMINYQEALSIYNKIHKKNGEAQAYLSIAKLYKQLGWTDEAKNEVKKSIDIAEKIRAKNILADSYKELTDLNTKSGDYKSALTYSNLYNNYKDSISSSENANNLINWEIRYQVFEKEQEIKLLKTEQKLNKSQIEKQNIFIVISIIFGFLALAIVSLVFYLYKVKKNALTKLAIKNDELNLKTQEITEQKELLLIKSKKLLNLSNKLERQNEYLQKLSLVASKTNNAIAIYLPNGQIEFANETFIENFKGIINGDEIYSFDIFKLSNYKEIHNLWNICIKDQRTIFYEYELKNNDKDLWFHTTLSPIVNEKGEVNKVISIDSDITQLKLIEIEKKKYRNELINQRTQLQIANATKDKFFSIIAHDLKAPFNSILGFSELLIKNANHSEFDPNKNKKFAQYIYNSSKMAYELLENLLLWSRSQRGVLKYNPTKIDLKNLTEININLFENVALKKDIRLTSSIEKNIFAYADNDMILTVIRNLISNALKFTFTKGEINISTKEENNYIITSISDSGIGINPENINKLFKVQENFQTPGTEKEMGTGLGLILCQEFIRTNKGKIWVESTLGKGSVFSFSLPQYERL